MVKSENEKLIGRLQNWKFQSALAYLEGESEEVQELVNSLAVTFEDSGWFSGNMATIVSHALSTILPLDNEE